MNPPDKTPLPTKHGSWSWHKRYFDVGDPITFKTSQSIELVTGKVAEIQTNKFGRVSYRSDKGVLILMEDVRRAMKCEYGQEHDEKRKI